jgi:hypothetical protein
MAYHYWQAKLWGLLHDPALKALHDASGRAKEGLWPNLAAPPRTPPPWARDILCALGQLVGLLEERPRIPAQVGGVDHAPLEDRSRGLRSKANLVVQADSREVHPGVGGVLDHHGAHRLGVGANALLPHREGAREVGVVQDVDLVVERDAASGNPQRGALPRASP